MASRLCRLSFSAKRITKTASTTRSTKNTANTQTKELCLPAESGTASMSPATVTKAWAGCPAAWRHPS